MAKARVGLAARSERSGEGKECRSRGEAEGFKQVPGSRRSGQRTDEIEHSGASPCGPALTLSNPNPNPNPNPNRYPKTPMAHG